MALPGVRLFVDGSGQCEEHGDMVVRPAHISAYEFVVLSVLRAQQLIRGCVPRSEGIHNAPTMAQIEVAAGKVVRSADLIPPQR